MKNNRVECVNIQRRRGDDTKLVTRDNSQLDFSFSYRYREYIIKEIESRHLRFDTLVTQEKLVNNRPNRSVSVLANGKQTLRNL